MPKLSILLPTFNRAGYLKECLDSLLTTTVDCEIFISDNASTDGTEALVRGYTDPRIRYFRQPENVGHGSFQYLYREARGEYLAMLGDDDRILPGCYEKKVRILDRCPEVSLVYSLWNRIDSAGKLLGVVHWPGLAHHSYIGGRDEFSDLLVASYIMQQAVMIRRSLFEERGAFDVSGALETSQDWDQYIRYVERTQTAFLHEPTVEIRVHASSGTTSVAKQGAFDRDRLRTWRRYLIENPNPPVVSHLHWQWMAQSLKSEAVNNLGAQSPLIPKLVEDFQALHRDYHERMERLAGDILEGRRPRVIEAAQVAWVSSLFEATAMADASRAFVLTLRESGVNLAARQTEPGEERVRAGLLPHQVARLDRALAKDVAPDAIRIVCLTGAALERPTPSSYLVGRTVTSTDHLPADWVERCNQLDELWVPSQHAFDSCRRAGVKVRIERIPDGVDTLKFRPGLAPLPLPSTVQGTVYLAVLDESEREGWDVLLRAWAEAFAPDDHVTLLLRMSSAPRRGAESAEELERKVDTFLRTQLGRERAAVARIVILGEPIPDVDMPRLYAAAQVLVAPSRGDGWGRVLLEAMACGLPVIATRWGGRLDFMTDDNSLLVEVEALVPAARQSGGAGGSAALAEPRWAAPSVQSLVGHLRTVLGAPERVRSLGARARADLVAKWRWDQVAALAQRRLVAIANEREAARSRRPAQTAPAPASSAVSRAAGGPLEGRGTLAGAAGAAGPQVVWFGAIYDPSGYADEARGFIFGLREQGLPIAARSAGRHSNRFREEMPPPQRTILDEALARRAEEGCIAVIHLPGYAFKRVGGAGYIIGRTMYETDSVPPEWVARCNELDEIWVPCHHNVETFKRAGVTTRIERIPEGVDTNKFRPGVAPLPLPGVRGRVFLAIFEWIYRKGWDVLLRAWAQAFRPSDDVTLVLRTYPVNAIEGDQKAEIERRIDAFLRDELKLSRAEVAPIVVLGEQVPDADMPRLYAAAYAYLTPSRGEGWGRPHMEAMSMGLPVVATRWSGNLDFMDDDNSLLVDVEGIVPVDARAETTVQGHRWAEPSVASMVRHLRTLVDDPTRAATIGARARQDMVTQWHWPLIAAQAADRLRAIETQRRTSRPGGQAPSDVLQRLRSMAQGAAARGSAPAASTPATPAAGTGASGTVPGAQGAAHLGASRSAGAAAASASSVETPRVARPPRSRRPEPFRLRWEGSQFVHHSLGHVNRELCASLVESGEVDLEVIPFEPDVFSPEPGSRLAAVKQRVGRSLQGSAEVHVRHQWPPRFDAPSDGAWVMIQPWEHGHVPANWVQPMRDVVDEIWVPTSWVRDCYIASGVPEDKVVVIPNGVDADHYRPDGPRFPLRTRKRVKLLFVGGAIFRKGIDLLIETYLRTFTGADDVCLVLKGFGSDSVYRHSSVHQQLLKLDEEGQQDRTRAEIEYLPQSISDDEIAALYRACDVFVLPYRGEGFGMPIAEAMATGLPVVTTQYGACLDFCDETTTYLVPAELRELQPKDWRQHHGGHWVAEPSREALAATLRHVVSNLDEARQKGVRGRERIVRDYAWSRPAELILERLAELSSRTPVRRAAQPACFYPGAPPFKLKNRKKTAFLLHPDWYAERWKGVLRTFVSTFEPSDDVTLVLWLDPHQSYPVEQLDAAYTSLLAEAGLKQGEVPDLLLVNDDLSLAGLGMLYSAVDCVLAAGDPIAALRARAAGKDCLESPTASALKKYVRRRGAG